MIPSPEPAKRKRSTATMKKMALISEYMYSLAPDMIAIKLNMKPRTVARYMTEILENQLVQFRNKDHSELISDSYEQYRRIREHGWKLFMLAVSQKDKTDALNMIRQSQEAEDRLMKICGIYKEVKIQISYQQIIESDIGKQLMQCITEFHQKKGIDPMDFVNYYERRMSGESYEEIQATEDGVSTDLFESTDDYSKHRNDIHKKRTTTQKSAKNTRVLGYKSRNIVDPRDLGAEDIHILEMKAFKGELNEEELKELERLKDEHYSKLLDKTEERRMLKEKVSPYLNATCIEELDPPTIPEEPDVSNRRKVKSKPESEAPKDE